MVNGACSANCRCSNGQPGTGCDAQNANKCVSCNSGYTLTNFQCVQNVRCRCDNGVGLDSCTSSAEIKCGSCNANYVLSNNLCNPVNLACSCINGQAASDCYFGNIVNKCISCNSGYELIDNSCMRNNCICDNGTTLAS